MSIILPEKVLKEVEKVSRREDTLPEEIINIAVIEFLRLNDPETKAEYEDWIPAIKMSGGEEEWLF